MANPADLETIVRRAAPEDKAKILDLGKLVFIPSDIIGFEIQLNDFFNNYSPNISQLDWNSEDIIRYGIVVSQDWYVAVDKDQNIYGFSGIEIPNYEGDITGTGWLNWTAITPKHQKNGIGSKLLAHCEAEAARHGITKFGIKTIAVYLTARRLYRKNGYTLNGILPDYYGNDQDMLIYYKKIQPSNELAALANGGI